MFRAICLFLAGAGIVVLLSSCGGTSSSQEHPASSEDQARAAPSASASEGRPTFAACMRRNGVDNFPDRASDGGYHFGSPNDVDPFSPVYQAAYEACEDLI
ncbi:hypothetical protein Areg01_82800 [Actinoplanes regularis]|nr:hypothetical protein Areg01_82800 [Actinoplanes regularis]